MSTLQDIRHGLTHAWDTVADGWRDFTARASGALTRFNPIHHADTDDNNDARIVSASNRWGVLAAEIGVNEKSVEVSLEIPGMDADDFSIDVYDDVLVVRGEKRVESVRDQGRYHVMERAYGRFERALNIPVAIDEDRVSARYDRGVLAISLPRAVEPGARRISVKSA